MIDVSEMLTQDAISGLLIGIGGAIVSFRFEEEELTIARIGTILLSGTLSSILIGSAICDWFSLSEKTCNAIRLATAVGSMRIFESIMTLIDHIAKNPSEIFSWIKNKRNER